MDDLSISSGRATRPSFRDAPVPPTIRVSPGVVQRRTTRTRVWNGGRVLAVVLLLVAAPIESAAAPKGAEAGAETPPVAAEPAAEPGGAIIALEPVVGALIIADSGETLATVAWGLNFGAYARMSDLIHLGGRLSIDFTMAEHCTYDGEYGLGAGAMCPIMYRSAGDRLMALLGTHFVVGFDFGERVVLRPSVGVGFYASGELPARTLIPLPSIGLDGDVALYRGEDLSVLLGVEFEVRPYTQQGVFMLPQGGVSLEF